MVFGLSAQVPSQQAQQPKPEDILIKKASVEAFPLRMGEEELRPIPSKSPAEMVRKVFYEVDPLVCPQCGGQMKVVSFLADYAVVDRIIEHLRLTFVAEKPQPHLCQIRLKNAPDYGLGRKDRERVR